MPTELTNQELIEHVNENPDASDLERLLAERLYVAVHEVAVVKEALAGYAGS